MVPFRLTQNVIDSFGVSGIEGVYRSCAEITLQARRGGVALRGTRQSAARAFRPRSFLPCRGGAALGARRGAARGRGGAPARRPCLPSLPRSLISLSLSPTTLFWPRTPNPRP